ncbi:MAG: IPT/TIG domain-containing protein [Desulfobulbaceae bacterium]|nr:IPT/TIG domain-containing protein [Desulfobulbaceae bacterium]
MQGERSFTAATAGLMLMLMLLLPLLGLGPPPAFGAESGFEIIPKWVRPGRSVTIKLGPEVNTATTMFLRLSGRTAVRDFPLNSDQINRRIIEVRIPAAINAGKYETSLVDQDGRDLGIYGSGLKIAASDKAEDKPVITKIVPSASYPLHGRYGFDIIGENFGDDVRGIKILINDTAITFDNTLQRHGGATSEKDCKEGGSCLVWGWKKLSVRGLSLTGRQIIRPMAASIAVDGIESDKKTIILSPVDRAMPGIIAFAALGILTLLVYLMFRRKASLHQVNGQPYRAMAFLFIEPKTNTFSLSQLQLILWLAAAVVAYTYLAASRALVQWDWRLCEVPENLPLLLGISAGTTVLSLGATGFRGSKGSGPLHPEWGDFISSGGVFAPERLQFFLWTVIGVFGFISATLAQDPASVTELPRIPDSFIPLMGVSSVGYLAGKVTRKPGPNISRVVKTADAAAPMTLRILGENLSPKAQVTINGTLLQTEEVSAVPAARPDPEFVTELIVTPAIITLTDADTVAVKIVNPDGQSAEI